MARPRTPTRILALRGAFRKDPQREHARDGEPMPKAGIGKPPKTLSPGALEAWRQLVDNAPAGSLGDADRAYLEVAAELLALKRLVGVAAMSSAKLSRLEVMLGKLGLRPGRN